MRIALVVNAASGSGPHAVTAASIRGRLTAAGIAVVCEPDPALPLPERMATAAAEPGIDALVVAGGDGSIACAAALLAGGSLPLGILPRGTMNRFAKDLGVPLGLDAAIANLRTSPTRQVDLGEVNGTIFLINSVLGMPARVTRHREALRRSFGLRALARWAAGIGRNLGRYPRLTVTGTVDGLTRRLRFRMLAVVVGDYVERPGEILLRAPIDGGRLTLYVLAKLSLLRGLRLALGFALGDWRRLPEVERIAIAELTIASRRRALHVMNDGEVRLIRTPLRYGIRPRALPVIAPEPAVSRGSGSPQDAPQEPPQRPSFGTVNEDP